MRTTCSRFIRLPAVLLLFCGLAAALPARDPGAGEANTTGGATGGDDVGGAAGPWPQPAAAGGAASGAAPSLRESLGAERILVALRQAYPGRIAEMARRDGDWAVRIDEEWYYWADGRLLPESLRAQAESYDRFPFYRYPRELPPLPSLSEAEKARMATLVRERERNPARRHSGFVDALWRVRDRASAEQRVKTTYFLGIKTEVHRELLEDLAAVEEEIQAAMEGEPALKAFVRSIRQLSGYNFRRIDGTSTLSYHAYGIALDIIPASYGGLQAYWRWAMQSVPDWYALPYSRRFMPPQSFVRAFERHGFVWGGKWRFFDTIHFEYRPEILLLSDLLPAP